MTSELQGHHGDLKSLMPAARRLLEPDLFNVGKMKVLMSILGGEICCRRHWLTTTSVPVTWDGGIGARRDQVVVRPSREDPISWVFLGNSSELLSLGNSRGLLKYLDREA